jgi:hypothetical protein
LENIFFIKAEVDLNTGIIHPLRRIKLLPLHDSRLSAGQGCKLTVLMMGENTLTEDTDAQLG